tara:strand:+ start:250 stop:1143 length:894 start_codon:yes stop_codon:yes gene_type:complete
VKIIIQIPCYNEEFQLDQTVNAIRSSIASFKSLKGHNLKWELLIIDDGSTDKTLEVASRLKVDHILSNKVNKGLAYTFQKGIDKCLIEGADLIINTDGDNQYDASCLILLIEPILNGSADIVIGDRQILKSEEFSTIKKIFQVAGSYCVRLISKTNVRDAPCGFRSFSRYAANKIQIFDNYTYTLENIIQASINKMRIVSVPVKTNLSTRESRLITSNISYIFASISTIIRIIAHYKFNYINRFFPYIFLLLSIYLYGISIFNNSDQMSLENKIIFIAATIFAFSFIKLKFNNNKYF